MWVYLPPVPDLPWLGDPPAGHPERLRPDIPLSDFERFARRQLAPSRRRPGKRLRTVFTPSAGPPQGPRCRR
ncbi:DUF6059 family protein [Streptomyces sp. NPDC002536]